MNPTGTADELGLPEHELVEFLDRLESVLEQVVASPAGYVPDGLAANLPAAWAEVKLLFEPARKSVLALEGTSVLDAVGLGRIQIRPKVDGLVQAFNDLIASPGPKTLALFLRWANNILKSLPIAVLVKEPIEEFKSAVETAAETMVFAGEARADEVRPLERPKAGSFKF
jgi:hypothetical protein